MAAPSTFDTQMLGTTCPCCFEATAVPLRVLTRKTAPKCPQCGGKLSRKALEVTMNEACIGLLEELQSTLSRRKQA